jgi:copper homeostasis protein
VEQFWPQGIFTGELVKESCRYSRGRSTEYGGEVFLSAQEVMIEACVNSVESAIEAEAGGACRVELCDNLYDGGTTPSSGSIEAAHDALGIKLNVIIRPRGGDFLYSDLELDIMRRDVAVARAAGADGVVFGILESDGSVNVEQTRQLVELAQPMSTTFHRAFDMCADSFAALEDLVQLGIDRVLTSGQRASAMAGAELIGKLVEAAQDRIIVMPGVGIDAANIADLIRLTGACEFHVLAERRVDSEMAFQNSSVFMGTDPDQPEFERPVTDREAIRAIVDALPLSP